MSKEIVLRDCEIGFRNFRGEKGDYNQDGARTFAIFINEDMAERLVNEGWNVKFPKENPNGDKKPYLTATLSFEFYPPNVHLIDGNTNDVTHLDEESVSSLDWIEISRVDVSLRPYNWEVAGRTGIKAYVKSLYVTFIPDDLRSEYGF